MQLKQTGSAKALAADARAVHARLVPYATSIALTRSGKYAQSKIIAQMPKVFDRPNRYTLNSTRLRIATVKELRARVEVKNETTNNGTLPENYLLPGVGGGGRNVKRFEKRLRYSGVLARGEYVVPGAAAPLDASGNLRSGVLQQILTQTRSSLDPAQNKTRSKRSVRNARALPIFAGRIKRRWGVWRRDGRRVRPVLIFTRKQPQYRARFPFDQIAEQAATERFELEYKQAMAELLAKR